MAKRYRPDGMPAVTEDEATELMVHHLALAHIYFQISPDSDDTRKEVKRLLTNPDLPKYEGPEIVGALAFFDALAKHYREDM